MDSLRVAARCAHAFYLIPYTLLGVLRPTFEADPIGRRLECLPKKGININFNLIFWGPRGAQGVIKNAPGAPGIKKKMGRGLF